MTSRPSRPVPLRRLAAPRPASSTMTPSRSAAAREADARLAAAKPTAAKPTVRKPAAAKPTVRKPAAAPKPLRGVVPGSSVTTYMSGRRGLGLPVRPAVVSIGSADRFAERTAARRRVVRRKVYLTTAGAVLALGLAWLALLSPVFAFDPARVDITGAGTVVAIGDVKAVVAGVEGIPLPRLDTMGLRDRVLHVPGVRQVRVTREWPRGLVISLVSREPVAAVPQAPATSGPATNDPAGFVLLDTEGYQVGWAAVAPDGLPVVSVPIDGKSERALTAVLSVLRALPAPLRAQVATVAAASQDTVQMGLRGGATVNWGDSSDAALKVAVLQALRAAPATARAHGFDVSAPTLPVTR
jgi:cell division protein FtsQ